MPTPILLTLLSVLALLAGWAFIYICHCSQLPEDPSTQPTPADKLFLALAATCSAIYLLVVVPSIIWAQLHQPPDPAPEGQYSTEGPNPPLTSNGLPQSNIFNPTDAQTVQQDRTRITDLAGLRAN